MYLFYVLANLLYWTQLPSPIHFLIPVLFGACTGVEAFLQFNRTGKKRRILTYVSIAMCAVCELSLWFIGGGLGTAIYISYHISATALCASIVGKVGCRVIETWKRRSSYGRK